MSDASLHHYFVARRITTTTHAACRHERSTALRSLCSPVPKRSTIACRYMRHHAAHVAIATPFLLHFRPPLIYQHILPSHHLPRPKCHFCTGAPADNASFRHAHILLYRHLVTISPRHLPPREPAHARHLLSRPRQPRREVLRRFHR